jgi:transposase
MRTPKPISIKATESLKKLLEVTMTKADFRRVLCIWLRARLSMPSHEVAEAVGYNSGTVRRIQARYLKEGESSLLGKGRGGRRYGNMSIDQEAQFLTIFIEKAKAGGVIVVSEIKSTYEKAIGHKVPKSTVYRMLDRHGWRKISPRPRHPKADKKTQEAFKKTSGTNQG